MKLKTLCSAALATAILFGAAAPALAAPNELDSTGTITYEEDNSTNPIVDPEDPEEEIDDEDDDDIITNPDGGSLAVDAVTNLNFMTQKAVVTDQTYFAKQIPVKVGGTEVGTRGNFVQVTDKRISNRTAWTLSAKMTQQFTAGSSVLGGATLTYTNPFINGAGADSLKPTLGSAASSFVLSESANEVNVMGTPDADKGFGTWSVEFGSSAGVNGAADTTGTPNATDANKIENGSVSLFVPGNIAKTEAAYTAKVLWTVATTPIN